METPIGFVPKADDINIEGLDISKETLESILTVNKDQWMKEAEGIEEFYAKFGDKLPKELSDELAALKNNLK